MPRRLLAGGMFILGVLLIVAAFILDTRTEPNDYRRELDAMGFVAGGLAILAALYLSGSKKILPGRKR